MNDIKLIPDGINVKLIVSRYNKMRENLRKACRKYSETHKEKINEIARNYYKEHKDNPEYKQKNCEKSKASYYRRKEREKYEKEAQTVGCDVVTAT